MSQLTPQSARGVHVTQRVYTAAQPTTERPVSLRVSNLVVHAINIPTTPIVATATIFK